MTIPEKAEYPTGPTIPDDWGHATINAEQYQYLMNPLRSARIATRQQGGKTLSYLEAWDVKAHLTRIFGFGNWDLIMLEQQYMGSREYESSGDSPKPMVEVIWMAKMLLRVRDELGRPIAEHAEAAVGSASGPASMLGEHHDNALKTAASDALKRCAINWGTQFGLSLYDNGARTDVIRKTLVKPAGVPEEDAMTEDQVAAIMASTGAEVVSDTPREETTS